MRVVFLLLQFVAGDAEERAGGYDDVVAAVGGGVVDGLVLACEEEGDAGGETAEGWWFEGFGGV